MNLFYVPNIKDEWVELPDEEARHATQVLRKKVGEHLILIDGKGGWYKMEIETVNKKACSGRIIEKIKEDPAFSFHLHIGIAPTKNINRFEWFLEKVTEFGISEISPIICQRSERRKLRMDRLEKILVAAMKQSLKAHLPKLNEPVHFKDFVEQQNHTSQQQFIAYLGDDVKGSLKANYEKEANVCILIGPEGDFSPEEIQLALNNKFVGVGLGPSRLRTETAGIAACHTVNLVNQK